MPEIDSLSTALPFFQWDTAAPLPEPQCRPLFSLDSVIAPATPVDTVYRPSLFTAHTLPVQHPSPILRPDTAVPYWVFGGLIGLTTLICVYYKLHKIRIGPLLQSVIDRRVMDRMLRDNNLNRTWPLLPMGMLMMGSLCMGAWFMAMRHTGFVGFLLLTAAACGIYLAKNGLLRLLAAVFDQPAAMSAYITSNYLFHLILATATAPLLFILIYMPTGRNVVLYLLAALCIMGFLWRFLRGAKLFLTLSKGSNLFLFYYLCTVEIIPILVLVKWFIEL